MSKTNPFFSPFLHKQFSSQNIGAFVATSSLQQSSAGRAIIRVQHQPYPRLSVYARGGLAPNALCSEVGSLKVFEAENNVLGHHHNKNSWRKGGHARSTWSVRGFVDLPLNDDNTRIGHVVMHLYNFRQSLGGANNFYPCELGVAGRSVWNFGPWQLQLDSFWQGSDNYKSSIERDQFFLTHVGYLERIGENGSGKLFGAVQAYDVCYFLELSLGFIEGAYVGPSLAAGRRRDDPFVWIWPGPVLRSPKARRTNWAFHHRYTGCMSVLEPLWSAWCVANQRSWLERAIPIYLEAARNDLPWDIRIGVAQTGLEMMASMILVEKDKVLSLRDYESLHTAAQIRALLEHLNLSPELPGWIACKPRSPRGDLADALADVRNAIIHPTSGNRAWLSQQNHMSLFHAWSLLLEFLELSILYAIGYQGAYATCVDAKSFDLVPWKTERTVSQAVLKTFARKTRKRRSLAIATAVAGFGFGLITGVLLGRRKK